MRGRTRTQRWDALLSWNLWGICTRRSPPTNSRLVLLRCDTVYDWVEEGKHLIYHPIPLCPCLLICDMSVGLSWRGKVPIITHPISITLVPISAEVYSYWVGAIDVTGDEDWTWVDGVLVPGGPPYWAVGEPSHAHDNQPREHCAVMSTDKDYYLSDTHCTEKYRYICKLTVV